MERAVMADPWEEAAKGYKPQPGQAPAANDDWKVWQASGAPAEQEGFLHSLGSSLGVTPPAETPTLKHAFKDAAETAIEGPIVPLAKSLYEGGKRSAAELGKAFTSAKEGNGYGVAQHAITALPIVGPALDKASDQYADKNYMGEAGTLTGAAAQIAPIALGGVDAAMPERPLVGEIPTRAKAGKLFESVMKDASKQPVTMTRSQPILERAMQLSDAGHGTITPLDKLYGRINQTQPLDYAEARDRASAISNLTGQDRMNTTDSLKSEAKKLSHAFNDDVGDAAASVGRGEDYAKAMKQYRQASQANSFIKKAAIPLAVGGATAATGPQIARYLKSAF